MNNSNEFITWLDSHRKKVLTEHEITQLRNGIHTEFVLRYQTPTHHYEQWQQEHEITEEITVGPVPVPATIENVRIAESIHTIADILNIIDKYDVAPHLRYNIDLETLHKIRPELCELNSMVGLNEFKTSVVNQLLYYIQELHLVENQGSDYKHIVLFGPPGTGKTEIAKLIGKIYAKIGVLKNNIFRKVVRSDLVAGYVGQTAIKTRAVVKECLGGVLFIDEAYSLALNDVFSTECIDTLCEALSDHKDELMVIVAGYEEQLKAKFFKTNPGLESRFIWRFNIPGYSSAELRKIYHKKVVETGWTWDNETIPATWFERNKYLFKHYGRDIEMLFIYSKIAHSKRIYGTHHLKKHITLDDIEQGLVLFKDNSLQETASISQQMMYL